MFTENQPFSRTTTTSKQIPFWSISQGDTKRTAFTGQPAQVKQATDIHQVVRQMASSLILVVQGTTKHRGEATTLPGREGESGKCHRWCQSQTVREEQRVWWWMQKPLVSLGRMRMYTPLAGNAWYSRRPGGLVRWACRAGREKEVQGRGIAKLYRPKFPLVHSYYSSATRKWGKHSVTVLVRHLVSFSWSAYE